MQARQQRPNWVDLNIQAHYQQNCGFVVADRYIAAVGGLYQGNVGPNNTFIKCLDLDIAPQRPGNPPDRFFCPEPTQDEIGQLLGLTGFSACFDGKNKIIVFGGEDAHKNISNEVFVITLQEQDPNRGRFVNCKRQETINNNGCHRSDHTAHIYRDSMYVIGGKAPQGQNNFLIWKLSLNAPYAWESINIPLESPHDNLDMSRWTSGHKSVLRDSRIYVYNRDERYPIQHINEHLYVMNLANQQLKWEKIQAPSLDPGQEPLNIDEMLEIDNRLYFFEKNPAAQSTNPLKILSYDIAQNRWNLAVVGGPNDMPKHFKLMTYRGRFILWGYEHRLPFNGRIFSLNLDGNNFPSLPQISRIPRTVNWTQRLNNAPRYRNSNLVVVGRYIIAIGDHPRDIEIYDPQANTFRPIAFTPDSDNMNLTQFSACAYKENKIIIYGGRININITNTVLVISLQEDERGIFANCKIHDTIDNNGYRRADHTAHIYENTMYVLGGKAGPGGDNTQIWKLSLNAPYRWESVNIPNNPVYNPNWVSGHKSVLKDGKIYVYNEDLRYPIQHINEHLYMMDLTSQQLKWDRIKAPSLNQSTEPLNINDMLEIDNKLYFFERCPPGQMTYSRNIHLYNIATNTWGTIGADCPNNVPVPVNFKLVAYQGRIILWEYLDQNNVVNGIIYSLNIANPPQVPDYPGRIQELEQAKQREQQQIQAKEGDRNDQDARIRRLEGEKAGLENNLRNLDGAMQRLEETKQNLNGDIVREEEKFETLTAEKRNQRVQSESDRIKRETNQIQSVLGILDSEVRDLELTKENYEDELNRVRHQNREIEKRENQNNEQLKSLKKQSECKLKEIEALEKELRDQSKLSTTEEETKEQVQGNLSKKEREILELLEENRKLEKQNNSFLPWLGFIILCLISLCIKKL